MFLMVRETAAPGEHVNSKEKVLPDQKMNPGPSSCDCVATALITVAQCCLTALECISYN